MLRQAWAFADETMKIMSIRKQTNEYEVLPRQQAVVGGKKNNLHQRNLQDDMKKRPPPPAHPTHSNKRRRTDEVPYPCATRKKVGEKKKEKKNVATQADEGKTNKNERIGSKNRKGTQGPALTKAGRRLLKEADRALRRRSAIHGLRLQPADKQLTTAHHPLLDARGAAESEEEAGASLGRLHLGWTCYVCKKRYDQFTSSTISYASGVLP